MSLNGKVSVRCDFLEALAQDLGAKQFQLLKALQLDFLDGSGLGQASKIFADSVSQIQSVNNDLDVVGTLAGAFGNVSFTALKGIIIIAGAANPGVLNVFGATNGVVGPVAAANDIVTVNPGGMLVLANPSAAGWPVTGGTADILRIASAANAGTYTYDVILFGI